MRILLENICFENMIAKSATMKKTPPKASFAEQQRNSLEKGCEKDDNVCQKDDKMEPTSMPQIILIQ